MESKGSVSVKKLARQQRRKQKRQANRAKTMQMPKRPWRDGNPSASSSSAVTKIVGAKDARLAKNTVQDLDVSTANPTITIEVPIDLMNLYGVCLSYVSYACSRGYQTYADDENFPYWASVYMLNVLLAYVQGSVPQAIKLPIWLQQFGQALSPKKVKCGNGAVFYRFLTGEISFPFVPPPAIPFGPIAYSYEYLLNIHALSGATDGFPISAPANAYTDANGSNAWSSLAQFMVQQGRSNTEEADLTTNSWSKNVSAFAMPVIPEGSGYQQAGGWWYEAGLEVPVFTPVLSVFATLLAQGAYVPGRVANRLANSSGDALYASACFHQLLPMKNVSTKEKSLFHFVDFLEFGDVLALYVSLLIQEVFNDPAYWQSTSTTQPATYQCPLSLQEMLLLLRNEMMYVFNRSQCADQGISPRVPSSDVDNQFQPFICSTTTVALSSYGMKLPLPFIENMKSLMFRIVHFKKMLGKNKNKESQSALIFAPVLGKYALDNLVQSDYTATFNTATPVTIDAFTTLATVMKTKRRESKGAETWIPFVETPINLIDGSTSTNYLYINDTTRLGQLATLWNDWISTLATYSDPLSTVSKELGVNVCCSVSCTRHWIPAPGSYKEMTAEFEDKRLTSRKNLVSGLYADRHDVAVSVHDTPISEAFDRIQKQWILPVNLAVDGATPQSLSDFTRVSLAMVETQSVPTANVTTGISMATQHLSYARKMIHGRDAAESEWATFFQEESKNGHGGVLSGLVADFIGKAFGGTAGAIAGTVASILPI